MTIFYLTDLNSINNILLSAKNPVQIPIIVNSPNSINYMGLSYIYELVEKLYQQNLKFNFICDVGDNAAYAVEAIRMNFKHVVFKGSEQLSVKLQQIAQNQSSNIYGCIDTACKKILEGC